jgi:hypothetical protein
MILVGSEEKSFSSLCVKREPHLVVAAPLTMRLESAELSEKEQFLFWNTAVLGSIGRMQRMRKLALSLGTQEGGYLTVEEIARGPASINISCR